MSFLGDRFRAAREARGLSLADVSEQIHIRALYLDCIEREDWASIGAPVYTRGFVRSYARFIGLDAEEAVREYAASAGTTPAPIAAPAPAARTVRDTPSARRPSTPPPPPRAPAARAQQPRRGGGPSVALYVLGFIALLLIGAVGYTFWNSQQAGHAQDAAPETAVTAAPIAAATPRPVATTATSARTLAFTITQRAWVQIALDGQAPVAAMLDPGTTKVFHGKTATLRVGNAGGVNVTVDGKSLGPLGASGAVVERTFEL